MHRPTIMSAIAAVLLLAAAARSQAQAAAPAASPPAAGQRAQKALAVLRSDAPLQDKFAACQTLAAVGDASAVPTLAGLLADEKLSHMARYALEPIPGPAADEALRAALGTLKGTLLLGVINSIGVRRDVEAIDTLAKLTEDADPAVAAAAAAALGRIGSELAYRGLRGLSALAALRAAESSALRAAAADASLRAAALLRGGSEKDRAAAAAIYHDLQRDVWPEHIRVGAFVGVLAARPNEAPVKVLQALAGQDEPLRAAAIAAIPTLKGDNVAERFAAEMPKLPAKVQVLLIAALVERGDPAARSALAAAAGSNDDGVRAAAAEALGVIGDAASVEVLCTLLADGKTDAEKRAAAASLRGLRADGVDAAIVARVKAAPPAGRPVLIDVLADRKAGGAVGELLAQAAQADPGVRAAAFKALGQLAACQDLPALLDLLVKLDGDAGRSAAEQAATAVCRRISDEPSRAEAALAALNTAGSDAARCSLLRVLAGAANARAFDALQAALKDGDSAVRDAAARGLADWPDARALPTLLELFGSTQNAAHRVLALRGCVRLLGLGDRPVAETLKTYAALARNARRADDKKLVLAGLAAVPDPEALKLVEPFLDDAEVRAEAELATLKLARGLLGSASEQAAAAARKLAAESRSQPLRQQAEEVLRQVQALGDWVTAWQVSDVCPKEGQAVQNVFAEAFPPETPGAKDVHWCPLPLSAGNRPWMFDLHIVLGGGDRACYVRTWIHSDSRQPARLEFGTDDGSKVWLNGKLIHSSDVGGAAVPGEHKIDVVLKEGWNGLMMKVVQISGPWQFCLCIRKPDGTALPGLRYSLLPPGE